MNRRSFLASAPLAAAVPAAAISQPNRDAQLEALLFISKKLGLSVDDVYDWLEGVDLTIVAANVNSWSPDVRWRPERTRAAFMSYSADVLTEEESPTRDYIEAQLMARGDMQTVRDCLSCFTAQDHPHMARLRAAVV